MGYPTIITNNSGLSPDFSISISPLTGRSYRATRDLPAEHCLLDVPTPYACTVYKQFRTEVCAECWRYECGRRGFLTCRDYAEAGLMFCDRACLDAWIEREGEYTLQMLKILEAARRRNDKGKAKETAEDAAKEITEETVAQAWDDVALEEKRPKAFNKWKQIQLDDFEADLARYILLAIIHMYRESQSNASFSNEYVQDSGKPALNATSFGGATWSDFATLQSGELQQIGRFPELLQNHIRIYQVLKSRFSSTPPSPSDPGLAGATDTTLRLSDLITITHVRVALAVDPGNSFGIWQVPVTEESEGLGFGIYPIPSFFNHHCSPNVSKQRIGRRLRFVTTKAVAAGEDLCIAYGHVEGMGLEERRKHLREGWFFDCQCSRCVAENAVQK